MIDEHGVPRIGDAFGAALLAALEHGASRAVIERDDGLVDVDQIAENYFGLPEAWAERCRWAVDRAVGRVLDIGAGAGRAGAGAARPRAGRRRTRRFGRCHRSVRAAWRPATLSRHRRRSRVDQHQSRSTRSSRSATTSGSWRVANARRSSSRHWLVSATHTRSSSEPASTRSIRPILRISAIKKPTACGAGSADRSRFASATASSRPRGSTCCGARSTNLPRSANRRVGPSPRSSRAPLYGVVLTAR